MSERDLETSPIPRRASHLARLIPRERLHPGALRAILDLPPGTLLCVAVSGGADSVALLALLWAHLPDRRPDLQVLHFDHRIRPESAQEALAVNALAGALGLPCHLGEWTDRPIRSTTETAARAARMDFLGRTMADLGARVLATGHHLDDAWETTVLRLDRGVGVDGLCGPRPVHRRSDGSIRLRPLALLERSAIVAALKDADLDWSEDSSNADLGHVRNRVRLQVGPALDQTLRPGWKARWFRSRYLLEEDTEAINSWLESGIASVSLESDAISLGELPQWPMALWRRFLRRWLQEQVRARRPFFAQSVAAAPLQDDLVDAVRTGKECSFALGRDCSLSVRGGSLYLSLLTAIPADSRFSPVGGLHPLVPRGRVCMADGSFLDLDWEQWTPELSREVVVERSFPPETRVWLDPQSLSLPLCVRHRHPGDRYYPLGSPGSRKLKDCLIDRHIPIEERNRRPLVLDREGQAIWFPGLPPSEHSRLGLTTGWALRLTYQPR